MESLSHAERQFRPTDSPRRGGESESSACVYFPFQSGCTSSAAGQADEDGESKWEKERCSSPPNTLSHSHERKVSSFLPSPTSFFPSFPFHPFAKSGKNMQRGRGSEEEKRRRKEDQQLRHGGMRCCFFLLSGSEQLQSARWGSSLYSSHPSLPFPACLQHMSPPIVAMATPPHVADRMRKKRGRGGDKSAEGKRRWVRRRRRGKNKSRNEGESRVKEENKAQNNILTDPDSR